MKNSLYLLDDVDLWTDLTPAAFEDQGLGGQDGGKIFEIDSTCQALRSVVILNI
jgi:hypothetical protein